MQRIRLSCNYQKPPKTVLFTTLFAKEDLVLVGVLLVLDSRIQKTNRSLLSIMKDQLTNQLVNIFREYLQKELSINV